MESQVNLLSVIRQVQGNKHPLISQRAEYGEADMVLLNQNTTLQYFIIMHIPIIYLDEK